MKHHVIIALDWSMAWSLAYRAAFVFPHRAEELRAYGDYIKLEFATKPTSLHPEIVKFDIATRNIVEGEQSILLTDNLITWPDGLKQASNQ